MYIPRSLGLSSVIVAAFCGPTAAHAAPTAARSSDGGLFGSQTASDEGTDVGVEAQAGNTAVKSFNRDEVDKHGNTEALSLFLRRPAWAGSYQLGAGWQNTNVEGHNRPRGTENQKLNVRTPFVEGRYLLALPAQFDFGVSVRDEFGKGADFGVLHTTKNTNAIAAGPVLGFTQQLGDFTAGVDAVYYMNFNKQSRQVTSLLGGITLAYHFPDHHRELPPAAPATPAPAPVTQAAPVAAPVAVAPAPVNDEEVVARFRFGSAELSAADRKELRRIGQALAKMEPSTGMITVAGHTDSIGPRRVNDALSQRRARNVCQQLVKAGLPMQQLRCTGVADTQPIANLSPTAAAQRRTTLVFISVPSAVAQQLKTVFSQKLAH